MKLTTAIASMERGCAIFASDLDRPEDLSILDGLVAAEELCKCEHGSYTWYFAWKQRPSESEADKANQIVKAIHGQR